MSDKIDWVGIALGISIFIVARSVFDLHVLLAVFVQMTCQLGFVWHTRIGGRSK